MNTMRRGVVLVAVAAALVVGGIVGASSFGAGSGGLHVSVRVEPRWMIEFGTPRGVRSLLISELVKSQKK